jgi:hypothetical protein
VLQFADATQNVCKAGLDQTLNLVAGAAVVESEERSNVLE